MHINFRTIILPTESCEMNSITKPKKNHRSMSVSMHYLNKNTYSLRHPAQLCKGKNKLHYILQNSIQSRERSVVANIIVGMFTGTNLH